HIDDDVAVPFDDESVAVGDLADDGGLDLPLADDPQELVQTIGPNDGHHPLLRLRHEDLLGSEGLIPQQHVVEGDVHAAVAVGGQLRGSARDASGPEVLDALDHTGVEELETALDEDLLCEGVTDLHGWALR